MTNISKVTRLGRLLAILFAALLTVGAVPAAAQDATPGATPSASGDPEAIMAQYGPVEANEEYTIAYLHPYPDNPFWQAVTDSVVARAEENGVIVEVLSLPSNAPISDQVAQMETAVVQQYDGIILGTPDAAGIVPGILAANEAGIPVLAVDAAPADGDIISLVQTDNIVASTAAGEFILEAIDGEGKVLNLQGDMSNQTAQARNDGLHAALDPVDDVEVIDQSAMWTQEQGLSITENILQSDPDIVAIFAANDPAGFGAVQALEAAGRDDVIVVGFDGTPAAFDAVADGSFTADIAQFPDVMGTVGIDLMVSHLNGEEIPETVDSGTAVVTQENVAEFQD